MPRVKADTVKNRLYLKFSPMDADELSDEVFEVVKAVRTLAPGFTCLTEIQGFSISSEKEERFMKLMMEFISLMGVSKVVRVGPKTKHNQLDAWSRECGGYTAQWVDSVEKAEKILASC
jgi:hypothetical protein